MLTTCCACTQGPSQRERHVPEEWFITQNWQVPGQLRPTCATDWKGLQKKTQHAIQKSDLLVIWYVHEGQAVTLFLVIVHRVRTSDKCKCSIWRWNFNSRIQNRKVTVRLKKTPLTTRWHLSKQHCINTPSQKVIWLQTASAPPLGVRKHPPPFPV